MKKSQIFLGVSAFLLAISGALATKASHRTDTHLAGFTISGACQRFGSVALNYTTLRHNNAKKAHTSAGLSAKTLYTVGGSVGNTSCGVVLYTNPQN